MRLSRLFVPLVAALVAAPLCAYTIYLKDGSRIIAKSEYVVQGELAIVTLPNGTKSSIPFAQIDIARTAKVNESNLGGTAVLIEGGQATDLHTAAPVAERPKLQDLIRGNEGELRAPPAATPPPSSAPRTPAAAAFAREQERPSRDPFPDSDLAGELLTFISSRGAGGVTVHRSARAGQPLLAFETASEGSVFKALLTSANALLHVEAQRPGALAGLELICETPDGRLGGRFELTTQLAKELVSGRYEITKFYVENVQF